MEIVANVLNRLRLDIVEYRRGYLWFFLTFILAYIIPIMIDILIRLTTEQSRQPSLIESELLIFIMVITYSLVLDHFVFEFEHQHYNDIWERLLYTFFPFLIIIFCILIYTMSYFRSESVGISLLYYSLEFILLISVAFYAVYIKHKFFKGLKSSL